ncbi:MAG: (d)CMP kinase [Lachnospiraceae bacterium]|nr:(d)CMP kinase [Lachnospiraceae bacterium]
MSINVAIDGPAGAGKSTIARKVAEKKSFIYVDTGAMFRAIGLYMLRNGIDLEDGEALERECQKAEVSIAYVDGEQNVILNGENVSTLIRTPEVGDAASKVSVNKVVRERLLYLQRELARQNDVVMDGRDIGTVVLPEADVKVFLTASVEVRAQRRCKELLDKGIDVKLDEIVREIAERDYRDMHRDVAPLKQAEDAVLVDTSEMSIEEACYTILKLIEEK